MVQPMAQHQHVVGLARGQVDGRAASRHAVRRYSDSACSPLPRPDGARVTPVFICETTPTGCPRSRPRVSLSIYLSIFGRLSFRRHPAAAAAVRR